MQRTTSNSAVRRVKKVAQRVPVVKRWERSIKMTSAGGAAHAPPNRVALTGLAPVFAIYPGLTPWATFLTRLTALHDVVCRILNPLKFLAPAFANGVVVRTP